MQSKVRFISLLMGWLVLSACDGPPHFMSGGELSGVVAEVPASWAFDEDGGLAQLETRPEDPYSINFTYVQLDGALYVYAGDTRTNWVKHIEQNPLVRVRVADAIYPVRALRVTNEDELAQFAAVWAGSSAFSRDPNQFEEVWLYRLESR